MSQRPPLTSLEADARAVFDGAAHTGEILERLLRASHDLAAAQMDARERGERMYWLACKYGSAMQDAREASVAELRERIEAAKR